MQFLKHATRLHSGVGTRDSVLLRYGVAVASVAVVLGLKILLDPLITEQTPFLLLAGAVVVGAWVGGLGPGLLATVLGTLGADYFFLPPSSVPTWPGLMFLPLLLFALQGALISVLIEALRSARSRAEASMLEARDHQNSLHESEERFELMVQGVEDYAIFMLDAEGHINSWNAGAERITGYASREIIGKHYSILYASEDIEHGYPEENLKEATKGGRHKQEGLRVRADGTKFWASVLITALRGEKGNLRGFSKVMRDVTERKRTGEKLRRRLDSLLALYETGQLLGSSLDREEIGTSLLKIVRRLPGAVAATIYLSDDGERLRAWRMSGPEDLLASAQNEPGTKAALYEAFGTKENEVLQTTRTYPRGHHLTGMFLPLRVRNRVTGVLEVYAPKHVAEDGAVETFASVANQAASALENARLYEELVKHKRRLQHLVSELVAAQEEERRRVAYEVHDGLAQTVSAAYQHLQNYAADNPPSFARGQEELDESLEMLRRTVGEARAVVAGLRPTVLDDFGLATALRIQVERLSQEGMKASYEETLGGRRVPEVVETTLFRVAQEALTNVRKHSHADRVHVELGHRGRALHLLVCDWGRGFIIDEVKEVNPSRGVGLSSMHERIALLDGHFEIRSEVGAGTSVEAEIPLREERTVGEESDEYG